MHRAFSVVCGLAVCVALTACGSGRSIPRIAAGRVIHDPVTVDSTQSRHANPAEARQWQKKPIAVVVGSDPSVVRFTVPGNGCKPDAVSAAIQHKTVSILLRPADHLCTTQTLLYEVTVRFAKPILNSTRITKVIARGLRKSNPQVMRLVTIIYG